jgi:DNA-binding Lrp family transcriptional regulator
MAHEMKGTYRVFVMLNTSPGSDEQVAEQLLKFKEITEVHFISGIYDLLAVVEASLHGRTIFTTIPEISQLLIQKIRKIEGVRDTNTLLPFRSLTKHTK